MESTNQKRMNNLLVRIGDEGVDFYYKNLEKLINITPQFMKQDDSKNYFLEKFRICIQKIPYKSFIYAVFYAIEINNYPEFEDLIDKIFEDLQKNLNELNLLEADNVLLFFGELIKLNVLSSFTFISILMDLVSGCENHQEHFDFFFYLTLNSIAHVQKILQEKFEMEFKNLIDDLERIVQSQIQNNPNMKNRWLYQYFQSLKNNINYKEAAFDLSNQQCLNLLKQQKTLRKTLKLNIQISGKEQPCLQFLQRDMSNLLDFNIDEVLKTQNSLNKHLLDIYIQKNFISYQKNINLLMDKFFFKNFGALKSAKDFILIKNLLLSLQNDEFNINQFIPAMVLAKLINCFDFFLFFNDCWKFYQDYFLLNIDKFTLKQLDSIVKNVQHLNYLTHKNFEIFRDDQVIQKNQDIVKFYEDLTYIQKISYNLNKEDVYNNYNTNQLKNNEEQQNNMTYSYINQYLLSNSDASNFFNFAQKVLGMRKEDQNLRKLFFEIFVMNSSQSFVHFQSYFEHYQEVLKYLMSDHEQQFYEVFINHNKRNYFILQKCLVHIYISNTMNQQELLNSIFVFLKGEDQKFDICLLRTLQEIQEFQLIYEKEKGSQIPQMLNQRVQNDGNLKQNQVKNRYVELFK